MNNNSANLYIVVPCYNEEAVLFETSKQLLNLLNTLIEEGIIVSSSRIVFVDDGSIDNTWNIICDLSEKHEYIFGIKLSHNSGHQNALLAGLMTVRSECDCAISIDADLQDDIHVIPEMVRSYLQGNDIVYGVRNKRSTDTFFKRTTAEGFYRLMQFLGADIIFNHADYRLMSKRALEGLSEFNEVNLFLRGIIPMIGYNTDVVYYNRNERFAGESKYPLKKMLSFAFDGITSLSVKPIRIIIALGALTCFVSAIVLIYTIVRKLLGATVLGWTSIIGSIWLLGGIQLMSIGLIGEYIGKIYKEVKHRPRYIIEEYKKK